MSSENNINEIFISYRINDCQIFTVDLHKRLAKKFGKDAAFLDNRSLTSGEPFDQEIFKKLRQSQLLILVVGKNWLSVSQNGKSRLFDKQDYVRREIECAIENNIKIIPLLINGAQIPSKDELPESLHQIFLRGAISINSSDRKTDLDSQLEDVENDLRNQLKSETRKHLSKYDGLWIVGQTGKIPDGAVKAGEELDGTPLFIARAKFDGGVQPGKVSHLLKKVHFGYSDQEKTSKIFEIYVGTCKWKQCKDGYIPDNALVAGYEANGKRLFVARALCDYGLHIGKIRSGFNGANISFDGREQTMPLYDVLVKENPI